ncbi:MAG: zinc-ribbon domain-containing protein, partial [Polyangiaceae bacterium]|nr:zinc-ribbon domain-containing protein [Polyangiaceae bacterium]
MKFLCQNCKAKYQIADEKLQSRMVRMKCRKCGSVIEVLSPTGASLPSQESGGLPVSAPPASITPRPSGLVPPRRSAPRGDAPRASAAPAPAQASVPRPQRRGEPGALADAFARKLRDDAQSDVSAAIEVLSAGATEEWYVGVNGVPLGPVRLSVLRQKAAQGVINEESLVWREGFEEWLPFRAFPELVTLLREAREMSGRTSLIPSQPPPRHVGTPAPAVARISPSSKPPAVAREPEEEPATVVASGVAALQKVFGHVTSDPFVHAPKIDSVQPSAATGLALASITPQLSVADGSLADEDLPRRSIVQDLAVGVRRQVRMHPAAYVLIAIAGGFGATGAVVLLTTDRAPALPPTIQVVTVMSPPVARPPVSEHASAVELDEATVTGAKGTAPRAGVSAAASVAAPAVSEKTASMPGRVGLGQGPSMAGPAVGPAGGGAGARPQLEQAEIERVVASQRVGVKRRCWEPALAARDRNAPSSAKVNVSIVIAPDG